MYFVYAFLVCLQKAKGTDAARKHTSETLKIFFSDPENRRKRSIAMKGWFDYSKLPNLLKFNGTGTLLLHVYYYNLQE